MCGESPSLEDTMEDYDLNIMSFMGNKRPLSSWLDFLMDEPNQEDGSISEAGIQQLFAIPVEQQMGHKEASSLAEQHIQGLILHLLEGRYGPDRAREVLSQQPQEPKREHSTQFAAAPLSPLGECCMARKFRKDCQLIQAMLGTTMMQLASWSPFHTLIQQYQWHVRMDPKTIKNYARPT